MGKIHTRNFKNFLASLETYGKRDYYYNRKYPKE